MGFGSWLGLAGQGAVAVDGNVDTAIERFSYLIPVPRPDGNFDAADRRQIIGTYPFDAEASATTTATIIKLVFAETGMSGKTGGGKQ